jgi:hypothetical protein
MEGSRDGVIEGAWRARQRADKALPLLNDFFIQRLALDVDGTTQVSVMSNERRGNISLFIPIAI